MSESPSPNGTNGRGEAGRFSKGNPGAHGNPYARSVARLRQALFDSIGPDDLAEVIGALLKSAKEGDVAAAKELLQRLLGPPESVDLMERLDALEQTIEQLAENKRLSWQN